MLSPADFNDPPPVPGLTSDTRERLTRFGPNQPAASLLFVFATASSRAFVEVAKRRVLSRAMS